MKPAAVGGVRLGLHFRLASATFRDWDRLYSAYVEQAAAADGYGFDCLTVAEHHFQADGYIPAPYVILGAFAARTKRVRLGTGVRPLPMIDPVRAAEDIAVLDNLSGGRALAGGFGLGGRPREYEGFGIRFGDRRSRLEEALPLVDRLLSEEDVVHEGEHFQVHGLTVTPRPVQQPRPPIWLAAAAEPAIERAARLADGWYCRPTESLEELKRLTDVYRRALDKHGKDWYAVEHIVRRDGWVGETDEDAWREALPALTFHYARDYAHIPDDASGEYLREYGRDRFVIGSPETVTTEIERYRAELGTNLMVIALDHPGIEPSRVMNATRLLGEVVLPRVDSRMA